MGMTLAQLKSAVSSYVAAGKQAGTWSASTPGLVKLLDKIAKTVQIDGLFADKLPQLDGEELPLGKTIEEYFEDLVPYSDYSDQGSNAMSPSYPTYRPVSYNYTLGRKVFKTTFKYDEYERACNSEAEFNTMANTVLKRLYDSFALFKYDCKKQILANVISKCNALKTSTSKQDGETNAPQQYHASSTSTAASQTLVVGDRWYIGASLAAASNVGIVVKARTATAKTWAEQISEGYIVELNLTQVLAIPENTATGEAFLTQVKKDVESAQFATEGNSMNGNAVGSEQGMLLIIKKGIKPIIDVAVKAGTFNVDQLAVPAEVVIVDDFGNDSTKCYAMLIDRRMARMHPGYMAVRENLNGEGDFINYFLHTENTAFISKNTFVKCYLDD